MATDRTLCTLAVGVLVAMFVAAPLHAGDRVLVWATGNATLDTPGVAQYLMDSGFFDAVDSLEQNAVVPLSQLILYDAVVYFSQQSEDQDPDAIGDVLADFADTGRCLVLTTFAWANQGNNTLGGRIIDDEISPFVFDGVSLYTWTDMASNDGSSLFDGVTSLSTYFHDDVVLSEDAILRASWDDSSPLAASKRNVIGVNFFPDSSGGGLFFDYDALLANAILTCSEVFSDGFETQNTSRWSMSVP